MVLLDKHHRPGPIDCAITGDGQQTCVDAAGLIWTCGYSGTKDATCINTGRMTMEDGR